MHKHVTLLALLEALKRKDKGFAYLETHAGRGAYHLNPAAPEVAQGIARFTASAPRSDELRKFAQSIRDFRTQRAEPNFYPGSPLLAAHALRRQDRAILSELVAAEAAALHEEMRSHRNVRVERGDGFQRLAAWLPPLERRALIFMDPPYEQNDDFARVSHAIADSLQRFSTGIYAAWFPIKNERSLRPWLQTLPRPLSRPVLLAQMWLYPRDSDLALNGSGLVIVNPPYLLVERMQEWLPELQAVLSVGPGGGSETRLLSQRT